MSTTETLSEAFRRDLQRLYDKHGVDLVQDLSNNLFARLPNGDWVDLVLCEGADDSDPARHAALQERMVKAVAQYIWRCRFDINQPAECSELATELLTLIDKVE